MIVFLSGVFQHDGGQKHRHKPQQRAPAKKQQIATTAITIDWPLVEVVGGTAVVGCTVGPEDAKDGVAEGRSVGATDGTTVGTMLGSLDGVTVEGRREGDDVDGIAVGVMLGSLEGVIVGEGDGSRVGAALEG